MATGWRAMSFEGPVTELRIEVDLTADMTVYNPFDFFVESSAETWPFDYPDDIADDLVIYRKCEHTGAACCRDFWTGCRATRCAPSISSCG